jgi:hypothetical protein
MSSEIQFQGRLSYGSKVALKEALEQVRALLAEEDEDLREIFEDQWDGFFGVDGPSLDVEIALSGPSDWWFAVETVVEILTEDAAGGFIEGKVEGAEGTTRYAAGGDEEEEEEEEELS